MNPIEQYFSSLKGNYRKLIDREDLIETVEQALNNTNNEKLINYFNHSLKYIKRYLLNDSTVDLSNL